MDEPVVLEIRYDRWCGWLLGGLGLGRRWSHVTVDPRGGDTRRGAVVIRMGWGFSAEIPLDRIVAARLADRPFIGWGVHGWRGRWLVNGSLQGVVEIGIDPPVRGWLAFVPLRLRTVYVSLADPDAFLAALARSQVR
jgi:hypothetical protein